MGQEYKAIVTPSKQMLHLLMSPYFK